MSVTADHTLPPAGAPSRGRLLALLTLGGLGLGAVAGLLASSGHGTDVVALAALLIPVLVWRQPQLGPIVIFASALLIEQFPLDLMSGNTTELVFAPLTGNIPLFEGIGSLHIDPADLLLATIFAIYLIRSSGDRTRWWPHSQVSFAAGAYLLAVLVGEINGIAHHGQFRESFEELRPFVYLLATYLLTAVMVRSRSVVHGMLWTLTACEAFKSVQAVAIWVMSRSWPSEPQNVIAHEEAMFESLFFFMVIGLWLYGLKGRLRAVSTSLVPLVFFADLVNDRRTSWLILVAGFAVLMAVGYQTLPNRRPLIIKIVAVLLACSAVYFPAFWNSQGLLGKPAEAARSIIGTPTQRDALSDAYRVSEDANLELNMSQYGGLLGEGFGRQINYELPMPGLVVGVDPEILYIPHNGVLYILLRLGIFGGLAFWGFVGAAIIAGCRLARCPDRRLALIGAMSAAAVVGWTLEGATDQGFTLYRATFVIGCMIGLAEACRHIYTSGGAASVPMPPAIRATAGPPAQPGPPASATKAVPRTKKVKTGSRRAKADSTKAKAGSAKAKAGSAKATASSTEATARSTQAAASGPRESLPNRIAAYGWTRTSAGPAADEDAPQA